MEDPERPSSSDFSGFSSTAGRDDGDSTAGLVWRHDRDAPPQPFPDRTTDFHHRHHHNQYHDDMMYQTRTTTERGDMSSPSTKDDSWFCILVSFVFGLFASMTLILGVYGSVTYQIGPNSSFLINPNHLFVDYIKVEQLGEVNSGPVLYGFYDTPALDIVKTWSEDHITSLPISSHKEWTFVLNEGSQINISYSINSASSSSLILVIAQGNEGLDQWLVNPSYPDSTLSWNNIHGNGVIQQDITKSSNYYVALGNLNSEKVEVQLHITVKAYVYNTTGAYYACTISHRTCTMKLFYTNQNAAVLATPGSDEAGAVDWYVKLSYGPRWITFIVGIGGMAFLIILGLRYMNKYNRGHGTNTNVEGPSDRAPLLSQKAEDLSNHGSSYDFASDHDEDFEEGKTLRDGESEDSNTKRLCAICFDAPRDCFFLPCGHSVSCYTCGKRIAEVAGTCPICRRAMKKVRRIYTA
ncbi:E3 ubiquitin-protein ligase APD2-like [Impatiens glandulifera]|uniref:E3 ubiquitin-protein ligase APD2-like n=1 Tax=Impatiens glandulifera TaxID=253017 RepID=UPI001FB1834B|nr:E3 ubiquitin-protein ligase APD2-like [Impatiens glandulifera]